MTKNDFSINLGDELEKTQPEETHIDEKSISTFQVDIGEPKSSSGFEMSQPETPTQESESKPVSIKEAKAQEEKRIMEDNRINIISEITTKGISVDEMPDQVDLEIFKKTHENKKKRKVMMSLLIGFVVCVVLGGIGYLVSTNRYLFASILGEPDYLSQNGHKQIDGPIGNCEVQNLLPSDKISMDINSFYPVYKADFEFTRSANIPQPKKDDFLKKLNIMVSSYNSGNMKYKDFRMQYNWLIGEIMNSVQF